MIRFENIKAKKWNYVEISANKVEYVQSYSVYKS